MAAANSEAQSLRESLGVRAACISWDCKGILTPILRTWVQKSTPSFTKSRTCGGLKKKTPFFREIRNAGAAPPSVPECPPPPPPGGSNTIRCTVRFNIVELATPLHVVAGSSMYFSGSSDILRGLGTFAPLNKVFISLFFDMRKLKRFATHSSVQDLSTRTTNDKKRI